MVDDDIQHKIEELEQRIAEINNRWMTLVHSVEYLESKPYLLMSATLKRCNRESIASSYRMYYNVIHAEEE